jgi:hypothetical protein
VVGGAVLLGVEVASLAARLVASLALVPPSPVSSEEQADREAERARAASVSTAGPWERMPGG